MSTGSDGDINVLDVSVFKVERGCPSAGGGCGCTGACHELIEVVKAATYFKLLGHLERALIELVDLRAQQPGIPDAWCACGHGPDDHRALDGDCPPSAYDAAELLRWAETYGHPEEWAKRAQAAHARAERLYEALRRIALIEPVMPVDADGAALEAAQRLAKAVRIAREAN